MLDGGDPMGWRRAQNGAEIGITDLRGDSLQLGNGTIGMLAVEHNASSGFGRQKAHGNRLTGMHADPLQGDRLSDSRLEAQQTDCHSHSPFKSSNPIRGL